MASTQVTLTENTVAIVPLNVPASRVIVTMESAAAETYVTADGSLPVVPSSGVLNTGTQQSISAVVGAQTVLAPPLPGGHMSVATLRLISAGTPVVNVEW